jgi:hypothetical protein
MRKSVLNILGILAIAALTVQTASATPRHEQKTARVPAPATQQFRNALGATTAPIREKSCDIIWCYEN